MTVRPDLNYPSVVIGTFVSQQLRMYSTLCVGVRAICQPGQNTGEGMVLTMKTTEKKGVSTQEVFLIHDFVSLNFMR